VIAAVSATIALMASHQAAFDIIHRITPLAAQTTFRHLQLPSTKVGRLAETDVYLKLELSTPAVIANNTLLRPGFGVFHHAGILEPGRPVSTYRDTL
jgi:hypothetical protein